MSSKKDEDVPRNEDGLPKIVPIEDMYDDLEPKFLGESSILEPKPLPEGVKIEWKCYISPWSLSGINMAIFGGTGSRWDWIWTGGAEYAEEAERLKKAHTEGFRTSPRIPKAYIDNVYEGSDPDAVYTHPQYPWISFDPYLGKLACSYCGTEAILHLPMEGMKQKEYKEEFEDGHCHCDELRGSGGDVDEEDEAKRREDWEEAEAKARNEELMKLVDGLSATPELKGLLGMVLLLCAFVLVIALFGALR